jgi:hypothetical protein
MLLIATWSPRAGSMLASVVAAAYLLPAARLVRPTYDGSWACNASFPARADWAHEHVLAECARGRASWCLTVLPFAVAPLLVALWGAWLTRKKTSSRWPLVWPAIGALPTVALIAAMLPAMVGWSPHDPRWAMGYLREWREAGARDERGGVCTMFLDAEDRLHGLVPEADLTQAHGECLHVCERFAANHHFNPGAMEESCARLGVRATPLLP